MKKLLLCSLLMIGFFANSNSNANETRKLAEFYGTDTPWEYRVFETFAEASSWLESL